MISLLHRCSCLLQRTTHSSHACQPGGREVSGSLRLRMLRRPSGISLGCALLLLSATASLPAQENSATTAQRIDHSDLTQYLDDQGTLQPIQTPENWQRRRQQILAGMEAAMGPLPDRSELPNFDPQTTETLSGEGFRRVTIHFVAEPGDRIPADVYYPDPLPAEGKLPAVVALHPTGALGKRIVAGDGPLPNRQYAVELAQRGYVVIAPDYPSFGEYKDYDFASDRYISGSMKGIFNHMRCVDYLVSLPEVDPERIGVIGHSLGGHNAMFVGVFDERIKVIVSSCGWTPFHDYYGGKIQGWTSDRYMPLLRDKYELNPDLVPFDFYEVVAALAPRHFFSSSPKEDSNFDVNGVRKAIPRALGVYTLLNAAEQLQVRYPDCEHDFPTETREEAYSFIDGALAHTPRSRLDFAAELPRLPPKSPAEAMQAFDLVEGFRIEQTAAEPLVTDPVAMSFDENGRLYVIEMKDYSEQDKESLGQIRLLTDTNGDGRFDESVVFAEGLSWPTAIICSQGGVFVGAAPVIYFLKDNTGDGKADEQRVVFTGFERTNVQGLLNSFMWGLDQRIHGATSSSGGVVKRADDPNDPGINLRGRDFSFDPLKLDLRPESGGAQHGMSFDDWGRKYVCSNSDHAQIVMYDDRDIARNPALKAPGPRLRIADDGGQAPVYRTSPIEPWRIVRTRLRVSGQVRGAVEGGGRAAGYFTGATGITIFRGDAWGEDAKGTVFVGDVGSNIVHRKQLKPVGAAFTASRIDENREFLRSSDVWFRPVQFANAPDGCFHVLDMYRETIEHPASLPPMIKQHLDLTSGRDRGRLYRVVPESGAPQRTVQLGGLSDAELVPYLDHSNAWHRETASRLLFERQATEVVSAVRELVRASETPEGRVQAIGLLQGLGKLDTAILQAVLVDKHPRVREVAVRMARQYADVGQLAEVLQTLANDTDDRVQYELAFTAGSLPAGLRTSLLVAVLGSKGGDPWIQMAALSSLHNGIAPVFARLLDQPKTPEAALVRVFSQLAIQESEATVVESLKLVGALGAERTRLKSQLILVALQGKPAIRSRMNTPELQPVMESILSEARMAAFNHQAATAARVQALNLLRVVPSGETKPLLDLLVSTEPQQVQSAALAALAARDFNLLTATLLERWSQLGPGIRLEAEETLFGRKEGTTALLTAIESGELSLSSISPVRLQTLEKSTDAAVRERVQQLLKSSQRPSRESVIAEYRSALEMTGNPGQGRQVFLKNCSTCHQLNGEGTEIGPNLVTIQNRGAEFILVNVLDPNREVNPKYINYLLLTQAGKTHTGMIEDETATSVTLMRAERKTDVILRNDIDEMRSSGMSIMPEGLEKEMTPAMLADLIAYLLSIQ